MNRFAKFGDVRAGANGLGSGTRGRHLMGEQLGDSGTRLCMALWPKLQRSVYVTSTGDRMKEFLLCYNSHH